MNIIGFEKSVGRERYRIAQIKKAVFCDLIDDWQQATTLPGELRKKLQENFSLQINAKIFRSQDGKTTKAKIKLADGSAIETVLMQSSKKRNTVCVSSQVGCALGCLFCATGRMGFRRNLSPDEIVEQVIFFARELKKEGERITNIVFMGMGEPFLNYENVIESIRILNDADGFNLGARHFSISTVGILEGIEKLKKEKLDINLAISLHAPDNGLRSKLIPINKKYPIEKVIKAVDSYIKEKKRKVMFEYILIKDVNDSDEQAASVARLMKKHLYHVNLIAYNQTGNYFPSPINRRKKFRNILMRAGVSATERFRFGLDLDGACGQLAGRTHCT